MMGKEEGSDWSISLDFSVFVNKTTTGIYNLQVKKQLSGEWNSLL